ncbi:MAG: hypothetical protein VZR53_00275 [Prevotella sp.]|nr:hypothetical protein [Prevotella sp.]
MSRSNRKYIDQAVEYLKNSNSIKLSEKELEDLQNRAIEVSGVSKSPFVKALAKEQGIAKEDYDKFVADYMYHKDNLDTERENLNDSSVQLNAKANEIRNESAKIENPSDSIFEEWQKNDTDNRKTQFESNKSAQIKRLQDHLKTLNDKLEKNPLTNSQKAEVE